jgi:glycosyltransferase involved in cell wall biosynthesis
MVTEAAASLSIIVPVYDEEQNLPTVAEKLLSVLQTIGRDYEIIFVNDGSRDRSAAVLDELAATDEHIKVVHFKRNFGQTSAMMAGLDYSSGEVIIPIDADLQNDPIDIPRLLERLDEGFDLVSGWRKDRKDDTLRRNLPSWVANWIISKISGVKLHDNGCTLKAYRRSIVEDIRLYGEMHRFLPVYASWSGARTTELPVQHHPRTAGESKYGLKRIVKVPLDLLVVKFLGDYSQKPIYVFGGFGLFSHAMALLTFVVMVYYKYWGGKSFIETPLPVLAALLILMGFISMLMGLIAELVVRTYHESQDKSTYSVKTTVNFPQDDR